MSKLAMNCRLEQSLNKTQCLRNVLEFQFIGAHQTKHFQILCMIEKIIVIFVGTNNQHRHTHLGIRNNIQHL